MAVDSAHSSVHDSSKIFELLGIYFGTTSFLGFALYILYRTMRSNPDYFLNLYSMSREQFERVKDTLNISWATLGWFSISVSFTMYNKWLMQLWEGGFHYPILMTTLHMGLKVLISWTWMLSKGKKVRSLSWSNRLQIVYPIGILTATDIVLSNLSIMHIPLSLYTALKATSPIFTYGLSILYGLEKFDFLTLITILLMVGGLAFAVHFSMEASLIGVCLVLLSALCSAFRWVLMQKLIQVDPASRDVFTAIYRFSPAAFLFLLPIGCYVELSDLLRSEFMSGFGQILTTLLGAGLGGFTGFALLAFELHVLKATSSLTLGVLAQTKEVLQILLSVLVYQEYLTVQTGFGLSISVAAGYFYSYIKTQKREDVVKGEKGGGSPSNAKYTKYANANSNSSDHNHAHVSVHTDTVEHHDHRYDHEFDTEKERMFPVYSLHEDLSPGIPHDTALDVRGNSYDEGDEERGEGDYLLG